MIKRYISSVLTMAMMLIAIGLHAAAPTGYYNAAEGKSGQALLKALEGIVSNHTVISYSNLWDFYRYADVDNSGYILDMYSTVKFRPGNDQCGNYSAIGDCYNREHSFPKSWFNDASPMISDAVHVVPTDGYVNNQRSNYPFGVCANGTRLRSNSRGASLGKLGASTYPGYSGTVFEPDDLYKGDFARIYFYMAAAYNSRIASWKSDMLAGNNYPAYKTWAVNMLLEWNALDPVSTKETTRNDVIQNGGGGSYKQGNRNPFVDHPELADYIWGSKKNQPWYSNATSDPTIVAPSSNSTIDFGVVATGSVTSVNVNVKGIHLNEDLELSVSGNGFTLSESTVSIADALAGKDVKVYFAAPQSAGTYTGTLTIESSETPTLRVPITANVLNGIPASATNIGATSFTARWTNQKEAENYNLYLYAADGTTVLTGYPVSVKASAQSHEVNNLDPLTTYYFQLKSNALESNKVKVTTLDVEHIIDILNEGGFSIKATRGQATLPVLEARVYTENINESITLTIDGDKFDISLDKTNWGKSLTIDADGEDFFVRLNDVSVAGEFLATLSASSPSCNGDEQLVTAVVTRSGSAIAGDVNDDGTVDVVDINCVVNAVLGGERKWEGRDDINKDGTVDIVDVNSVINIILNPAPPVQKETFTEDFEDCDNNFGYSSGSFIGHAFKWTLKDIGIYGDINKHGSLAARLGKTNSSALTMAQDITTGASQVSFYASSWSGDGELKLSLDASVDGGSSWTNVKSFTVTSTSLTQFTIDVNYTGNVRFRLVQTAGKRGNIDDIAITNNPSSNAPIQVVNANRAWDAVATAGGVMVSTVSRAHVAIYNIDAIEVTHFHLNGSRNVSLPAGTYIVAIDNQSKKIIVK